MATSRWRLMASPLLNAFQVAPDHTVVVVFLRGGCDGLQLVAPVNDRHYHQARPAALRVGEQQGYDLGSYKNTAFRLHPKAGGLKELFDAGDLAIVHGCGLQNGTRSHFDAMDLIERGLVKQQSLDSGWMARALEQMPTPGALPAVSATANLAQSMAGSLQAASMEHVARYRLTKELRSPALIQKLYANDPMLGPVAEQTLATLRFIETGLSKTQRKLLRQGLPGYPKNWPSRELSRSLQSVATLVKMGAGLRMVNVDYGGWDTHEHQENAFPQLVQGLSDSLTAFYHDMRAHHERLTVVVMTEFGRRVRANRSQGTDHGHGNWMLVLGGGVKGGKHYGKWPGLAPELLDKRVDLAVTTDYRQVLAEVLQQHQGVQQPRAVFPGLHPFRPLGFA